MQLCYIETKFDLGIKLGVFFCFICEDWSAFALVMLLHKEEEAAVGRLLSGIKELGKLFLDSSFLFFQYFVGARKLETN